MRNYQLEERFRGAHKRLSESIACHIALVTIPCPAYNIPTFNLSTAALAGYLRHLNKELEDKICLIEPDITMHQENAGNIHKHIQFIENELTILKPPIIGISARIGTEEILVVLLKKLLNNSWSKNSVIVIGNAVTVLANRLSEEFKDLIYVLGEGELAINNIYKSVEANSINLSLIPNTAYRTDSNNFIKNPRKEIRIEKQQWLPALDMLEANLKIKSNFIIRTSTGCVGKCGFCSLNHDKKGWSHFPIDRTLKLMKTLETKGICSINIVDDEVCGKNFKYIEEMADRLIQQDNKISFNFSIRLDHIWNTAMPADEFSYRKEVLKKLRKAGLKSVFVGAESGSATQLRRYRKGYHISVNTKALDLLLQLDIQLQIGFIMFDYFINRWELTENIEYLEKKINGHNLYEFAASVISTMRPQKNTKYTELLKLNNLLIQDRKLKPYYTARFVDPRIEILVKKVSEYNNCKIPKLRYKLIQLGRISRENNLYAPNVFYNSMELIKNIHALDISFIKSLINSYPVDNYDNEYLNNGEIIPLISTSGKNNNKNITDAMHYWQKVSETNEDILTGLLQEYKSRLNPFIFEIEKLLRSVQWQ